MINHFMLPRGIEQYDQRLLPGFAVEHAQREGPSKAYRRVPMLEAMGELDSQYAPGIFEANART